MRIEPRPRDHWPGILIALVAGLHKAIQNQVFVPLVATSAETNVGVSRLMDFIAKYGSSPLDRAEVPARDASGVAGSVPLSQPEPVVFIFKTMNEPGVGELSLFRVYSGTVKSGEELLNTSRDLTERLGQLYVLNGHDRTPVPQLRAGDLGAVVKLRATHTGDTLCSPKFPVVLPAVEYPRPNIHGALRLPRRHQTRSCHRSARCPVRSPMEVGARAGRRGALLRSCPPASPCGRPLLLYFAAQSAPPARSGHAAAVFDDGTPPPSLAAATLAKK